MAANARAGKLLPCLWETMETVTLVLYLEEKVKAKSFELLVLVSLIICINTRKSCLKPKRGCLRRKIAAQGLKKLLAVLQYRVSGRAGVPQRVEMGNSSLMLYEGEVDGK